MQSPSSDGKETNSSSGKLCLPCTNSFSRIQLPELLVSIERVRRNCTFSAVLVVDLVRRSHKCTIHSKPYPLTTVELQKAGSRMLRLTPKKVLDVGPTLFHLFVQDCKLSIGRSLRDFTRKVFSHIPGQKLINLMMILTSKHSSISKLLIQPGEHSHQSTYLEFISLP